MRIKRPRPKRKIAAMVPVERDYLSPGEYAQMMGVTLRTVQDWCKSGTVPAVKIGKGRLWRIPKSAVK